MTGREFAIRYYLHPSTIRKWVQLGKLKAIGTRSEGSRKCALYRTADLHAAMAMRENRKPETRPRAPYGSISGEPRTPGPKWHGTKYF